MYPAFDEETGFWSQSAFYTQSAVCILYPVYSLHFIPSLQSAFYTQSAVCILYPVYSLHFIPSLQSAFYTQSTVCILYPVYSLHFTPNSCSLHFILTDIIIKRGGIEWSMKNNGGRQIFGKSQNLSVSTWSLGTSSS